MKKILAFIGITSTLAVGAVDASSFSLAPLPEQASDIAGNRVSVKQTGNIVETRLKWKDQSGIKVKYDMGEPSVAEKLADKRDAQVVTELVDFGDGGFKVDVLLNKKPKTNTFCYEIEGAENYDFFYQPALTQEDIDNGAERPENIIGSYAVYHKSLKNNEYKTGKVMHIPRPQVWEVNDKASTTVWAELSYTEPNLCVTVDQGYLNKANYPVRVDPTFGYTSIGASNANTDSVGLGYRFSLTEDGTVSTISVYTTDSGGLVKVGAYDQSDSSLVIEGNNDVASVSSNWVTDDVPGTALTTGDYWLIVVQEGGVRPRPTYDTGITAYGMWDTAFSTAGSAFPSTLGTCSFWCDKKWSIYATYTASGGGEATTTPRITLEGDVGLTGDIIVQ